MARKIIQMTPAQNWYARFDNGTTLRNYPIVFWATYDIPGKGSRDINPEKIENQPVGGVICLYLKVFLFADELEDFNQYIFSIDPLPEEEEC